VTNHKISTALVLLGLFTSSTAMAIGLQYNGLASALGWGSSFVSLDEACDDASLDAEAAAFEEAQANCVGGTVTPLNIHETPVSMSIGLNGESECEVVVQMFYRCTI